MGTDYTRARVATMKCVTVGRCFEITSAQIRTRRLDSRRGGSLAVPFDSFDPFDRSELVLGLAAAWDAITRGSKRPLTLDPDF